MSEHGIGPARFCSQCGRPITVADARFCKECGAPLADTVWLSRSISWHPLTALMLSVVPGLGHWYKGQRRRAPIWFLVVIFLYINAYPFGLMMHMICGGNAALAGAVREEALTRGGHRRRSTRLGERSVF
jgi:predicted nucleic acid-binding Zn ribbon protein